MFSSNVNNAIHTNSVWTGDAQDFFARQHDDHMQKYRWHKFTSQFKEISTDELLREAGLRK